MDTAGLNSGRNYLFFEIVFELYKEVKKMLRLKDVQ